MPTPSTTTLRLESIWDYPAVPRLEETSARIQVIYNGFLLADSRGAHRLLKCGMAPQYFVPGDDVLTEYLVPSGYSAELERVGVATFYTLAVGDRSSPNAAWSFLSPAEAYADIAGAVSFHSAAIDAAFVDGEPVHAPSRETDGGWVTRTVIGTSEGYPKGWRR